jgi:hypothetical protein
MDMSFKKCFAGFVAAVGPTMSAAAGANVNVLSATYGQSCGATHGNVTLHVKTRCDGKANCPYLVDAAQIGDAAPNCAKNFLVLYACQGQGNVRLAQVLAEANGKVVTLACTP